MAGILWKSIFKNLAMYPLLHLNQETLLDIVFVLDFEWDI